MPYKVVINDSARARWQSLKGDYTFSSAVLAQEDKIERLLTQSRFCEQVIRQQPECLHAIIDGQTLEPTGYRSLLAQELLAVGDQTHLCRVLARFRNRQMLAICWHYFILRCYLQTVLLALS